MDLLLSKLQIVQLNEKDVDDCLRLLVTFPLADSEDSDAMDLRLFRATVADDWGWWKTVTLNLARIRGVLAEGERAAIAGGRLDPRAQLDVLDAAAQDVPKSRRWKLRARIGERVRWYEEPEETPHDQSRDGWAPRPRPDEQQRHQLPRRRRPRVQSQRRSRSAGSTPCSSSTTAAGPSASSATSTCSQANGSAATRRGCVQCRASPPAS
ncbi:MAG TPA: hypothetical protein VMU39_10200 [Solirubrobacteraceae bacterium]|nr:hypothetical protein [Solirubrobacteraceae bacterium]